jgi:8-oxo-dGTP diphosphatase
MAVKGKYVYDWPRPMVTVDAVVFRLEPRAQVLLIKRGSEPYKDHWAFPGGFVEMDEELEHAVARELQEETALRNVSLTQMHTFGTVGRDPRGRQITIAFFAIADQNTDSIKAADDAAQAQWFSIDKLPEKLAFDHDKMAQMGIEKLKAHRLYKE